MSKLLQQFVLGLCLGCYCYAFETGGANDITAVSGRTSKDYVRTRLTNGSFSPESYAFGKGGAWKGAMVDASMDKMGFLDVAHIIADPLASQNYFPSKDPKTAKLLIMVYWGTTHAPEHAMSSVPMVKQQDAEQRLSAALTMEHVSAPTYNKASTVIWGGGPETEAANNELTTAVSMAQAANAMREQEDALNITMLGYDSWWEQSEGDRRGTALEYERGDLLNEIEDNRYFVVLMAYDFQLLWKQKKHKLLWETRFSIRQRHHDFDKDLPAMAHYASQYFGQDSGGLVHKAIPLGRVDIGEVKSLGTVPEK